MVLFWENDSKKSIFKKRDLLIVPVLVIILMAIVGKLDLPITIGFGLLPIYFAGRIKNKNSNTKINRTE